MAEMPQPQGQPAQGAPKAQGPSQLLASAHQSLSQLQSMMSQAPSVSDEDKQKLDGLLAGLQSFADGLSSGPGPQPQGGVTPVEAGARDVKPAM